MYTDFYEKVSAPWRRMRNGGVVLARLDTTLRIAFAAAYIALIAWMAIMQDGRVLHAVAVPLATFLAVSILRRAVNAQRPYEAHPITPLIPKDTQGCSMPSRHMASATIIAFMFCWATGPVGGGIALAGCAMIAYVRIAGGVHFPRDVIVAAALATICAFVGFVALG